MKISRIWKIYFSATGTTKKVVDELASALEKRLGAKGKNCNPMELLSYDFTLCTYLCRQSSQRTA